MSLDDPIFSEASGLRIIGFNRRATRGSITFYAGDTVTVCDLQEQEPRINRALLSRAQRRMWERMHADQGDAVVFATKRDWARWLGTVRAARMNRF